jgi:hypothetical protein
LISRAESHYQSQSDEIVTLGTHTIRARTNEPVSSLVVVLGPGTPDAAKALAAATTQPGSGLALICCDAIPNSAWRLVTNNGRTTIEPTGLTVEARHLRPSKLDDQANQAIVTTFGKPTSEPTDELPTRDSEVLSGKHLPTEVETTVPAGLGEQSVESNSEELPKVDVTADEEMVLTGEVAEPTVSSRLAVSARFDQMMLLPEPHPDTPPAELSVAEKINHIMRRRPVELVLLNGPPRLEGITWNGKDAARVDEIVAFLALNGPSTLSQVATAIWPEKVRPGDTAKQLICRARKTLGLTAEGNPRITAGSRSAPYRLTDVGCDWHRFEQLCTLAETEPTEDRSRLLQTALSLVRTPPFEAARTGAFHWASDICFDSRMRLKISEATHRYEEQANEPDTEWARVIRMTVTL